MDKLRESGVEVAKKPTDRFAKPTSAGYRDVKLNVRYPNGHIGELQIHVKPILKAKEQAHKDYEVVRSIEAKAAKEKRDTLTEEEQVTIDEANVRMKKAYEGAWAMATGKQQSKAASVQLFGAKNKTFFELNGNPVEVERMKFPVMYVNGKQKVYRDFFRLLHDGNEIDEKKFNKMVADQMV